MGIPKLSAAAAKIIVASLADTFVRSSAEDSRNVMIFIFGAMELVTRSSSKLEDIRS